MNMAQMLDSGIPVAEIAERTEQSVMFVIGFAVGYTGNMEYMQQIPESVIADPDHSGEDYVNGHEHGRLELAWEKIRQTDPQVRRSSRTTVFWPSSMRDDGRMERRMRAE